MRVIYAKRSTKEELNADLKIALSNLVQNISNLWPFQMLNQFRA